MKTKSQIDAQNAGLVYVSNHIPGIKRKRSGKGYAFYLPNGDLITDQTERARIKSLGIPPAYTNVWISPLRNSHLQATGVDAKGRTQYRYHPRWREYKNEHNFERIVDFAKSLSKIRAQVKKDLQNQNLDLHKSQVLATIVHLLDITLIRVGNDRYVKENDSYGLTTLRKKHLDLIPKTKFQFEFKGKSHKDHLIEVKNKKLFQIVSKCMEIPGYELFKYIDHNENKHDVTSTHVNIYLQNITAKDITAKDFRTWWATTIALDYLKNLEPTIKQSDLKKNIVKAVKFTASKLGNTPSVCRKYYIYPNIIESYLNGTLNEKMVNFDENIGLINLSIAERRALYFIEQKTSDIF